MSDSAFSDTLNLVLSIWAFGIGLRFLLSLTEAHMLGVNFSVPPHPGNFVIDFGPLVIMGGAGIVLNLLKVTEEIRDGEA